MKRERNRGVRQGASFPTMKEIAIRLKDLRHKRGLTLDALAERAGLTPNYIGTIEHGLRDPSLSTIESLAAGLGIQVGEIFGPTTPLSDRAVEMARLFGVASYEMQKAILNMLHAVRKPEGTK
jgi:transcriptional regulator with XRE-family HTH domain